MAKVDLTVAIDPVKKTFRGGELIQGEVIVSARETVDCPSLQVYTYWQTVGRGNKAEGTDEGSSLFQGGWVAGNTYRYRFELRAPNWPPTVTGTQLSIEHSVRAEAELAWQLNPKGDATFVLQPGPRDAENNLVPTAASAGSSLFWPALITALMAAILIVMLIVAVINPTAICPVALIAIVPLFVSIFSFREILVRLSVGQTDLELDQLQIASGKKIRGVVRLSHTREILLDKVEAKLTCYETTVSGSGKNRSTSKRERFSQSHMLCEAVQIQAAEQRELPIEIAIPTDQPPSVNLSCNAIEWSLSIHLAVSRWPDRTLHQPIVVLPQATTNDDDDPSDHDHLDAGHDEPPHLESPHAESSHAEFPNAESTPMEGAFGGARPESSGKQMMRLSELIDQLHGAHEDTEQIQMLIDAVRGLSFHVDATLLQSDSIYGGHTEAVGRVAGSEFPIVIRFVDCEPPPIPGAYRGTATLDDFDAQSQTIRMTT
jgi:hypothetical protein